MSASKLERIALLGMAVGVALMLQPWWGGGLRAGFFVTALSTIAQIVCGHWPRVPHAPIEDSSKERA